MNEPLSVLYFSSCSARMLNATQTQYEELIQAIFFKLGLQLIRFTGISNFCCGLAFKNKGFSECATQKNHDLEALLWEASKSGTLPIICDTSSCVLMMQEGFEKTLAISDVLSYLANTLPKTLLSPVSRTVMLHVPCSMQHLGTAQGFIQLAQACAKNVILTPNIECCGFAGDKGFLMKALNHSALSTLKSQIPKGCTEGYSASPSCEIGLTRESGIGYRSLLYLVAEALQVSI